MGPIRDQGTSCGSCWAFATVCTLEAAYFFRTGNFTSLSEQQLVDCAPEDDGCYGCNGGVSAFAMLYTDKQPVMSAEDYPYVGEDTTCSYDSSEALISAQGTTVIASNEPAMMQAALALGPLAVSVDASSFAFKHYKGNKVFSNDKCYSEGLNHAVNVVGYSVSGD